MTCSGWRTYGTISATGILVQPAPPARARDAPINCRNPRRETASSHSDAPLGNSRCIISRNSGEPASSSRLRQYSGPLVSASFSSTVARSSFLLGQTSSRFVLIASSICFFRPLPTAVRLTMTRATAGNVLHGAQLVLLFQHIPQRCLIDEAHAIDLYWP